MFFFFFFCFFYSVGLQCQISIVGILRLFSSMVTSNNLDVFTYQTIFICVGLFGFIRYCEKKVDAELSKIKTASKKTKILLCISQRVSS